MATGYLERQRIMDVKDVVIKAFNRENWLELAHQTGFYDRVKDHSRLLRSLSWGDEDYPGNVLSMLLAMADEDEKNVEVIESYMRDKFDYGGGVSISSVQTKGKRVYFTPSVFELPTDDPSPNLLSVMMPFSTQFQPVYASIAEVASYCGLDCKRADNI